VYQYQGVILLFVIIVMNSTYHRLRKMTSHAFEDVSIFVEGTIAYSNPFPLFKMKMRRSKAPFPTVFATYNAYAVHIWETTNGRCIRSFQTNKTDPTASLLLSSTQIALFRESVYICNIETGQTTTKKPTPRKIVYAFLIKEKETVTVCKYGSTEIWNKEFNDYKTLIPRQNETVKQAIQVGDSIVLLFPKSIQIVYNYDTTSIDGDFNKSVIAAIGDDKIIEIPENNQCTIYSVHPAKKIDKIQFPAALQPVRAAEYLGGDHIALTCIRNSNSEKWGAELFIYDLETSKLVKEVSLLQKAKVLRYLGGDLIMCIGDSGIIFVVDISTGKCIQKLRGGAPLETSIPVTPTFSPEKKCWEVLEADVTPTIRNQVLVPSGEFVSEPTTASNDSCSVM
jgi:hypothetical protein